MNLTKTQIEALKPCREGLTWYLENVKSNDLHEILTQTNAYQPDWARWLFTNLMNLKQKRQIAVFAAEQVLHIFEAEYPEDKRPRLAIEAAKAVIENDTEENRAKAAAASYSSYATSAAYAADYASAASEKKKMEEIIIKEAVRLLDEK